MIRPRSPASARAILRTMSTTSTAFYVTQQHVERRNSPRTLRAESRPLELRLDRTATPFQKLSPAPRTPTHEAQKFGFDVNRFPRCRVEFSVPIALEARDAEDAAQRTPENRARFMRQCFQSRHSDELHTIANAKGSSIS